jgi:hypothetical protein
MLEFLRARFLSAPVREKAGNVTAAKSESQRERVSILPSMTSLILVVVLAGGGPPDPDAGVPSRDRAAGKKKMTQILARDPAPTGAEVRATDSDAPATLSTLTTDKSAPAKVRIRAIDLWGELAPSTLDLTSILSDRADDENVRIAAMKTSLRVRGEAGVSGSRALLDDPKPSVRIAAADVLGRLTFAEAREALRQRLDSETDPLVRSALERALARSAP